MLENLKELCERCVHLTSLNLFILIKLRHHLTGLYRRSTSSCRTCCMCTFISSVGFTEFIKTAVMLTCRSASCSSVTLSVVLLSVFLAADVMDGWPEM